eukprot:GEMP01015992.1.p1 GENE.GEMP01015992.1~~GEMP01015992.1.p1  ORF type:complete len:611 (+),score=146.80 GEMP01015992.1:84-1916(+)
MESDNSGSSVYSFGSEDDDLGWIDTECHRGTSAASISHAGRGKPYELQFTCLSFPDGVSEQITKALNEVRELTALDEPEAVLLERHYKWQLADLTEQWFADPSSVCRAVGIEPPASPAPHTADCAVCYDPMVGDNLASTCLLFASRAISSSLCAVSMQCDTPTSRGPSPPASHSASPDTLEDDMSVQDASASSHRYLALPCGHAFCVECWRSYLETAVGEGNSCLHLKCMSPKCSMSVPWNLFGYFMRREAIARFMEFMKRNFVENNPLCKWCPEPDCPNAILVKEPIQTIENAKSWLTAEGAQMARASREVVCKCGWRWCFVCNEEAHRGISCVTVKKWVEKNQDEAENVAWILANTKPCPKCKNPIEKNQGCMHMVCRCSHQFCWLCLADDYNYSHTRDGRPCNKYLEAPDVEKETSRRNLARYAHYFERYRSHHHAQKLASHKTLREIRSTMEDLQKQIGNWMDVMFLEEAIQQVIGCRRMLKWTYAHGYFAMHSPEEKDFFEFQQGQLEQKVDQLQEAFEKFDTTSREKNAEAPDDPDAIKEFKKLKLNLTNLTKVVDSFFTNLTSFFESTLECEQKNLCDKQTMSSTPEPVVAPPLKNADRNRLP